MDQEIDEEDLFDRLDIGLIVTGVTSRRIIRVNKAAGRILDRDEASLVGMPWEALIPVPDRAALIEEEREATRADHFESPRTMRFNRPDGAAVLVRVTTTRDDSGDEPIYVGQIQDVTEQEQANFRLKLVLDNSPVSMLLIDRTGRVLFGGGGSTPDIVDGIEAATHSSVFEVFADQPVALALVRRAFGGESLSQVVESYGRNLDLHLMPVTDTDGKVMSVAAVTTDVTDRERAQAEQTAVADLAQHALDTLEPTALWHHAASILADRLGATAAVHEIDPDVTGPHQTTLVGPAPPSTVTATIARTILSSGARRGRSFDTRGWRALAVPVGRSGHPVAVLTVLRPSPRPARSMPARSMPARSMPARSMPARRPGDRRSRPFTEHDQRLVRAVASVLGSAAIRFAMEREVRHRSLHDPLTDLPNRAALLHHLGRSLERDHRGPARTGIVFVDLDGFKVVNDTYGHRTGDGVLREVASRLRASVRPDDLVARLGGDEFAVLCRAVGTEREVEQVAHRVITALAGPIHLTDPPTDVTVTASAGVALSGPVLVDPDRLLNASDVAMYAAKRAGPGHCVVHTSAMCLNESSRGPG